MVAVLVTIKRAGSAQDPPARRVERQREGNRGVVGSERERIDDVNQSINQSCRYRGWEDLVLSYHIHDDALAERWPSFFFFWSRESFACMPRLHVLFRLSGRTPPEKLDGLRQAWLESCFALLLMLALCLCVYVFGLV